VKDLILGEIRQAVAEHAAHPGIQTRWGEPLVGYAAADDGIFRELKAVASPQHFLPRELLPEARTVVAFFLPFQRDVARSNLDGELPSPEWSRAYMETNNLITAVCARLKAALEAHGLSAAVTPATHNYDPVTLLSRWSHRHVAYAAGLGAFGLNNMLITPAGCCGRLGSFVTSARMEPDPRHAGEACLFRHDGSCGRCARRCPVRALSPKGFARQRCGERVTQNAAINPPWAPASVCGKCLVGLPCSFTDPVRARQAG
jgi:epoxyqueuosine reductase QueG